MGVGRYLSRVSYVELPDVDDDVLKALVRIALDDANADEVTPPLSGGSDWTMEREQWFRDYHRSCRAGLDGPGREATWAIRSGGVPVGAVRLKRTWEEGALDTGIWLARSARGRGWARPALVAVIDKARSAGASVVRADTARPTWLPRR